MNILIHLGNQLIAEAIHQFLITNGYDDAVMSGRSHANGFIPQVLLVDATTVRAPLLSAYPNAKVIFIDTGLEMEKLLKILLFHDIHGVVSTRTELQLLKRALTEVTQGQFWTDDKSLKVMLQDSRRLSNKGKIKGITERHQEIIEYVRQGLSNKEIAQKLMLSEDTVKAHLSRIFRRLHITSRDQLMALTLNHPDHRLTWSA